MVRVLIGMRSAALRNMRRTRLGVASGVVALVVGLLLSCATLGLGFTAPLRGGADQLALVLLAWAAGRIGFAAFSGPDPALPLDILRPLPLERRRLANALLVIGFVDPSLLLLAVAAGSLVAFGVRQGVVPGVVGALGAVLYVGATCVASSVAAAAAPSGSRARRDAGTLLAALLISAVFVTGTAIPSVLTALADGRVPVLAVLLRILPTGWAPAAISSAAAGALPAAVGLLVLLVLLTGGLVVCWPAVLRRRLESDAGSRRRSSSTRRRRVLLASAVGAVAAREVRLWIRDPTRAGMLVIAFVVGLGVCTVPLFTHGAVVMLPFAGLGTALIAGAVAGNSYGFDGSAIGLTLTVPGSERADVRGRQAAWLLLVAPYAVVISVVGVLLAGADAGWAWPWVLVLLPSVLGGAAGASALISAVAPQPLADGGGLTPAWTVKVYATLIAIVLITVPGLAVLIVGDVADATWAVWAALAVSIVAGFCAAWGLGRVAIRILLRRGPELLAALTPAGA